MPRRSSRESLQHELKKRRAFVLAEVEAFLNMQRTASMLSRQAESLLKAHGLPVPHIRREKYVSSK